MFQYVVRGAAALSLAAILAGCNTSGSGAGGSGVGGLFGSSAPAPATASAPAGAVVQGVCPQVVLDDVSAFYRTYAKSGSKDDQDVVFQASLAQTTRACTQSETGMTIKVQVAGRLVAGPQGHAGTLSMPIRVSVKDGDQVIASELVPFSATLANADQSVQFLFSKDVSIAANPSATTQVIVGFDENPAKAVSKKTPSNKKHK